MASTQSSGSSVRRQDPQADFRLLATTLRDENARLIAAVLALAPADVIIATLREFSLPKRKSVLHALAELRRTDRKTSIALLSSLAAKVQAKQQLDHQRDQNSERVAMILRHCDAETRTELVQRLKDDDPELVPAIGERSFPFSEILHLSDNDLRTVIRRVELRTLATALQRTPAPLLSRVRNLLTPHAAWTLSEEMVYTHAVSQTEIETARQEICDRALPLRNRRHRRIA